MCWRQNATVGQTIRLKDAPIATSLTELAGVIGIEGGTFEGLLVAEIDEVTLRSECGNGE